MSYKLHTGCLDMYLGACQAFIKIQNTCLMKEIYNLLGLIGLKNDYDVYHVSWFIALLFLFTILVDICNALSQKKKESKKRKEKKW